MNLLLESMTPLEIGPFKVRIWREELMPLLDRAMFDRSELAEAANAVKDSNNQLTIARAFISVPHVNAVEVLDGHGYGIVLYKDWP